MKKKTYYWIKLDEKLFQTDSPIDYLMSVPGGCEYVVLYIELCLMAKNTDGKLVSSIGDIMIPYDVEKIRRETKYFSKDTILVALELYKKLGLVYAGEDGIMTIANYDSMVGSETNYAQNKRLSRKKEAIQIEEKVDNEVDNVYQLSTKKVDIEVDKKETLSHKSIEYRDKSIDIKDKSVYEEKHTLGTHHNVFLSESELDILKAERPADWLEWINKLSSGIKTYGYKYNNHLEAIRRWIDNENREKPKAKPKNGVGHFENEHNYSESQIDNLVKAMWG